MFLNKKPSPGLAIVTQIILIFGILSCNSYNYKADSLLEKALQDAGTNRVELEKVLNHYSSAKDSLKLKSAIFLIKYMPGKYAKVFPEYDSYTPVFDTLAKLNEEYEKIYKDDHAEFYKHYKKTALDYFLVEHHIKRSSDLIFEIKEDIKTVTADYLIENIDYAFKAWQMPWNRSLRFSDFCEFMLPYRYGNEELQPWRKAFYEENIHLLDSFKNDKDPVSVCMYLKGLHDVSRSEM
ncbi:MAG: hypothetical protein JWR50_3567, partial [Mucilaginibacter sp.]|nr:hypothetical protein [Mucilaginibacter sp.]